MSPNEIAVKIMNSIQLCDTDFVYSKITLILTPKYLLCSSFLLYVAKKNSASDVYDLVFI